MNDLDSKIKRNIEDIYDLLKGVDAAPAEIVSEEPKQIIFYGAPGTGKSHTIKKHLTKESVIRTTFHPDSDYSSFVGSYKPTTKEIVLRDLSGHIVEEGGKPLTESKIIYEFVNQSFLNAYINAWKFYAAAQDINNVKKQFLVIEEINRGNCAQIFGDIFQLLDRNDEGFSDYPVNSDADMRKQLKRAFDQLNITVKDTINKLYPDKEDIVSEILNGEVLVLPNNLYIWATMNTSDQSLFPIDSAFKRRWDWKYMPIYNANKGYAISVGDKTFDWWNFLSEINKKIYKLTYSEDKKLGYFFCKTNSGIITSEKFVEKVIFYLWNEIFKDLQDSGDSLMANLSFDDFFLVSDSGDVTINELKVEEFLKRLNLEPTLTSDLEENSNEEINDEEIKGIIKINGEKVDKLTQVPAMAIKTFIKLNPAITSQEIIAIWEPFSKYSSRTWIVCDNPTFNEKSAHEQLRGLSINCPDGNKIWVNKNGWMHNPDKGRDTISEFIQAVNESPLGITITEE